MSIAWHKGDPNWRLAGFPGIAWMTLSATDQFAVVDRGIGEANLVTDVELWLKFEQLAV